MTYETIFRPANKLRNHASYRFAASGITRRNCFIRRPFCGENFPVETQTVIVSGLTNREFLEKYMHPGRIGLCGGVTNIDKAISRAQRHLDAQKRWSDWT